MLGMNHAYESLGCIDSNAAAKTSQYMDYTCMHQSASLCLDGLPFFALVDDRMTAQDCFNFCLSKGLDLFGVLSKVECRCGASLANEASWNMMKPRDDLLFAASSIQECSGTEKLEVYRYTGHFESGSLPPAVLGLREEDPYYLDSMVTGRPIPEESSEDGVPAKSGSKREIEPGLLQQDPDYLRSCSEGDDGCGPGGRWPKEGPGSKVIWKHENGDTIATMTWKETVAIDYFFQTGLDQTRKEAFREAITRYVKKTCIRLKEKPSADAPTRDMSPIVQVGNFDEGCWANLGYGTRRRWKNSKINLGWCKTNRHIGTMVHEIGHMIGLNHEQKRPDATASFHGHGPYLEVKWQNMVDSDGKDWTPQFLPDPDSYVGSIHEGTGDPFSGYASYDFNSIMHYGSRKGKWFNTYPSGKSNWVGQRQYLTAEDVFQVLDMYQCQATCKEGLSGDGSNYRGCQQLTKSGRHCQMWTLQRPHKHTRTPSKYRRSGLADHNFCRNPDGEKRIWCYTQDETKRWEFCNAKA